jgi:predicted tellurium resistance membrane protein TerC
VFAVDSVPAVFAVTVDPLIVYTSSSRAIVPAAITKNRYHTA